MTYSFLNLRLQGLRENIEKAVFLVSEYETELTVEDDPQRKARCELRKDQLKKTINSYQKEFDELQIKITNSRPNESTNIDADLQEIGVKIDALGNLILRSHNSLIQQLNKNQLSTVEAINDALENSRIPDSELNDFIHATQDLIIFSSKEEILAEKEDVLAVINDPTIDIKHKVKISIPIVPFLIDYESEVEFGNGLNLKNLWNRWKNKFDKL
jgi:hypothetical protein